MDVNELLRLVQALRALGTERLYAVGIVDGKPVRFAVLGVGADPVAGELELIIDRRTWEGIRT